MGNRFGFVSLLDVKNTGEMERNLFGIRMGDYRLSVNVARYSLEDGEVDKGKREEPRPKTAAGNEYNEAGRKESFTDVFTGSTSFRDIFLGKPIVNNEEKMIMLEDEHVAHAEVFGKAVILRVVDFLALKNITNVVNEMTEGKGVVQYMGGLYTLVYFPDAVEAESFRIKIKTNKKVCLSVESWMGQTLPFERLAWLRIQGVPLHLLDNVVLNRISERFGKVVHEAQHDRWASDLSFDYVGVLLSDGKRVQEEVIVSWKGRKYRVWVAEEAGDWLPDFSVNHSKVDGDKQVDEDMPENASSEDGSPASLNDDAVLEREQCSAEIQGGNYSVVNEEVILEGIQFSNKDAGKEGDVNMAVNYGNEGIIGGSNDRIKKHSLSKRNKRKKGKKGCKLGLGLDRSGSSLEKPKGKKPRRNQMILLGLINLLGLWTLILRMRCWAPTIGGHMILGQR
ncbi:hypothetical protein HanHA300_Chr05g0178161 [Helianthus annuus]|nr:hypothetical protein HanHA300_Chr05g0178161 [Helianthus annuus]KAJ0747377.1 hypothetical protein HanOQP8_Chr05g0188741 [Helianthus annuus]KAJ0922994.1 hypothetical protein HanPSC8_Chr05g0210431 [Helianthus annuus]